LDTGQALRTLTGHTDSVQDAAVSTDGRLLISVSRDHTLRLWDFVTGGPIAIFTCDAPVLCCAFAGSSKIIAGDQAGRVHFLSIELA
jgi:WD40 repeat protein